MMGETHIATGVAAAIALTRPASAEELIVAVAGGALGSVVCDLDARSSRARKDAARARAIALVVVAAALAFDWASGGAARGEVAFDLPLQLVAGVAVLVLVGFASRVSAHRSFSHSLLALFAFEVGWLLVLPSAAIPFAVGFLSHIALDVLNHQPVRIFFPLKCGFGLGLFRSKGAAGRALLAISSCLIVFELFLITLAMR